MTVVRRWWHRQTILPQTSRAALRLALTPLCSSVIGWDWIVINLDRSVIGPGSTVTHNVSQRESPLKRLHELCETCHSKPVFHYTAVKYLRRFLILALQLDRNAPCEWAVDGTVTEGLVKIQSTRKWKQPKRTSSRSTIEQFWYWFYVLHRPQSHMHVWLPREALNVAFTLKLKSRFSCSLNKVPATPLHHEFRPQIIFNISAFSFNNSFISF